MNIASRIRGGSVAKALGLKRMTVTAEVTDLLRQRIISGYYQGGDQLRQETIASELAVSRIPVREALLQLESECLVINQPHKGAMVSMLSIEDAREIFDARYLLEPVLVKAAIQNATAADIERVRVALRDYEIAVKREETPEELSRLNWALHNSMCEPAQRPRTMAIVASLHHSADRYLRLQINVAKAQKDALEDHRALFEAFASRDVEAVTTLLSTHIHNAGQDVFMRLGALLGVEVKRKILEIDV